jgi:hypothetical protein
MPRCSSCRIEKEIMRSPKTCEDCGKLHDKYNQNPEYVKRRAETNKLWRSTKNGAKKQYAASKKWRENNRDRYRELANIYTQKNGTKPSYRLNKAKQQAKSRGIDFLLSLEEYTNAISVSCYYCDGAFGYVTKGTGLDRIDNNKGYMIGNVVSCCRTCNRIKGDTFTMEETKIAVKAILTYRCQQPFLSPTLS